MGSNQWNDQWDDNRLGEDIGYFASYGFAFVLFRHVIKNAMLPYVTSMCMQMGSLLSGSMMIESIFGWKGMGQLFYQSVSNHDFPTAQLCFLVSAFCVVMANLISDIVIAFIDPRIAS